MEKKDVETGIEASVEKRMAVCSPMYIKIVKISKKKQVAMTKHVRKDAERNVDMTEKESVLEVTNASTSIRNKSK